MDLTRYQDAWERNAHPAPDAGGSGKAGPAIPGTVKNDEGLVQYDQIQVEYCHITSPINGRVGLRLVDPGNLVTANGNTALLVITQIQPITVVFTLAEDNLDQVLDADAAWRQAAGGSVGPADDQEDRQRRADTMDNQIDTTTGTVKLRATFHNQKRRLFPNSS